MEFQSKEEVGLTRGIATENLFALRRSVEVAYPAGLPSDDPVILELENRPALTNSQEKQVI